MKEPDVGVEQPLSAADALAIVEREQARTGAQLAPNAAVLLGVWGLAWVVAGVVFFLHQIGIVAGGTAGMVGLVIGIAATLVSIVVGTRSGRGVRGASGTQGAMYGISWAISMTAMSLVVTATADTMPVDLKATLIPALYVFLAGVLYLAGGAVWRDTVQYGLGVWIIALAVVSLFAGQPANSLILGIGGGGAFIGVAAWSALRRPRA